MNTFNTEEEATNAAEGWAYDYCIENNEENCEMAVWQNKDESWSFDCWEHNDIPVTAFKI